MATNINNKLVCNEPHANLDSYYGPYNDVNEAYSALSDTTVNGVTYTKKSIGLTVGIWKDSNQNEIIEYWFKGGLEKSNLVEKNSGGGGLPGNIKIVTFDKNGGSGVQNSILTDPDGCAVLPECTLDSPGFKNWSYNGADKNPGESIQVGDSTIVYAIWQSTPATYTVSWTNGSNVTITGKVGSTVITSGSQVNAGSTVVLTATPDTGYQFESWTGKPSGATESGTYLTFSVNSIISGISATAKQATVNNFYYYPCGTTNSTSVIESDESYNGAIYFENVGDLKESSEGEVTIKNGDNYTIFYVVSNINKCPILTFDTVREPFDKLDKCEDEKIQKYFYQERKWVIEGTNETTKELQEKGKYIYIFIEKEGRLKGKDLTILFEQ